MEECENLSELIKESVQYEELRKLEEEQLKQACEESFREEELRKIEQSHLKNALTDSLHEGDEQQENKESTEGPDDELEKILADSLKSLQEDEADRKLLKMAKIVSLGAHNLNSKKDVEGSTSEDAGFGTSTKSGDLRITLLNAEIISKLPSGKFYVNFRALRRAKIGVLSLKIHEAKGLPYRGKSVLGKEYSQSVAIALDGKRQYETKFSHRDPINPIWEEATDIVYSGKEKYDNLKMTLAN